MKKNTLAILGSILLLLILGYIYHINREGMKNLFKKTDAGGATRAQRQAYNAGNTEGPFKAGDTLNLPPVDATGDVYAPYTGTKPTDVPPGTTNFKGMTKAQAEQLNEAWRNGDLAKEYTRNPARPQTEQDWKWNSNPRNFPEGIVDYDPPSMNNSAETSPPVPPRDRVGAGAQPGRGLDGNPPHNVRDTSDSDIWADPADLRTGTVGGATRSATVPDGPGSGVSGAGENIYE